MSKKLVSFFLYILFVNTYLVGQPNTVQQLKVFQEGIISTGDYDTHPAFSPTGDTLFFVKCSPDFSSWTIFVSYKINDKWLQPEIAEFSGYMDADPFFSKDGNTLFFISDRLVTESDSLKTDLDIWKVEKTKNGWSEPIHLGFPINSDKDEFYPTLTDDGTIYFGSKRENGFGSCDIYKSELVNGEYKEVINLGENINTPDNEYEPFISHDESFLIFVATHPQGLTNADLYISYNKNGNWTKAEKLPYPYSSDGIDFSPKINWDGKHFIFSSTRNTYVKNNSKPETTEEYNKRIRGVGNGLGDIYLIDINQVDFLQK